MPPKGKAKKKNVSVTPTKDVSLPLPEAKIIKKKKTKSGNKRRETFSTYIYKVLKQIHPETGISSRSMSILNSLVNDIYERIVVEAAHLTTINKKKTMSSREVQSAVRLILPGELSKHAISEGYKAMAKYTQTKVM